MGSWWFNGLTLLAYLNYTPQLRYKNEDQIHYRDCMRLCIILLNHCFASPGQEAHVGILQDLVSGRTPTLSPTLPRLMGNAVSTTCSSLACADGLGAQEVCAAPPCNWDTPTCQSEQTGCACPQASSGIASSILPDEGAVPHAYAGFSMLWLLLLLLPTLAKWCKPKAVWQSSASLADLVAAVPPGVLRCWAALCTASTAGLVGFASLAPPGVWGGCEAEVCVYHSMFCEPTRHGSAVRHPANFWSNLPYLYVSLFLLCQAGGDALGHGRGRGARPYALLDAAFGLVLFGLSLASLGWHASNCPAVHFVDIGLMDSVIAWFPLRTAAMACSSARQRLLLRRPRYVGADADADADASLLAGLAYAVAAAAICRGWYAKTEQFSRGFPTGRARSDLVPSEVLLFVGLPALYPVPALATAVLRGRLGHAGAMRTALVSLALGFSAHGAERLALDLWCDPSSYLQPTAALHVCTGVTIGAGYVWARSIEGKAKVS